MSSNEFIITKEMTESDECPLNCPNLGGHHSNPWTCKACGNLCDTYDMGENHNYPLKGAECTLPRIFYARHFDIVEALATRLETRGDYDYPMIERAQEAQTAAALRFLIAKAARHGGAS